MYFTYIGKFLVHWKVMKNLIQLLMLNIIDRFFQWFCTFQCINFSNKILFRLHVLPISETHWKVFSKILPESKLIQTKSKPFHYKNDNFITRSKLILLILVDIVIFKSLSWYTTARQCLPQHTINFDFSGMLNKYNSIK